MNGKTLETKSLALVIVSTPKPLKAFLEGRSDQRFLAKKCNKQQTLFSLFSFCKNPLWLVSAFLFDTIYQQILALTELINNNVFGKPYLISP